MTGIVPPSVGGRSEVAQDEVAQRTEDHHEAQEGDHVRPEGQLAAVPPQQVLRGYVCDVTSYTAVKLRVDGRTPIDRENRGDKEVFQRYVGTNTEKIYEYCCFLGHTGNQKCCKRGSASSNPYLVANLTPR